MHVDEIGTALERVEPGAFQADRELLFQES